VSLIDLRLGDCLDVLRTLASDSVDSIVTDPPYGLSFMGKRWDYDVPSVEVWAECLRVLKPGGHLLAFAGTRTQHRMAVRIEDAGFEIRDLIAWVYGSGFPKSLDVSKAIDKAAGVERDRVPGPKSGGMASLNKGNAAHGYRDAAYYDDGNMMLSPDPATDAARQWAGWGTALKPALEPITVARKPLIGTVAANVLAWGTGALNVDGCRVGTEKRVPASCRQGRDSGSMSGHMGADSLDNSGMNPNIGRWPANLIHDGSDEVVGLFPEDNSGSAARFFYCAKASKADRDEGCEALPMRTAGEMTDREEGADGLNSPRAGAGRGEGARNFHPTVKPTDLMRYLCRLVTQPGGTVLDPFMGSGSTGKGAMAEGFRFIGIERDPDYFKIAEARVASGIPRQPELF
jgi:site-specific DNA-methyltransferase (adenine-specific)